MLAFPQCPTMAVKSVFKICVTLKICAFGFSSWRVGVGSASAVRPHTAAWQRPGLAFTAHVFGWGRGGGLADGFGTGVWAAPDARPDAGAGAELAGACGALWGLPRGWQWAWQGRPQNPGAGPAKPTTNKLPQRCPSWHATARIAHLLGRAASHREVVGSSPCLTSFGVANVFCLPMQAAVLRWRTPFPSFRSPPPASNIQA